MEGFIILGVFLVCIFLEIPIAVSLALASSTIIFMNGLPYLVLPQQFISGVNSFSFLAIPFFFLAGEVMSRGNITHMLVAFANIFVGRLNGGLGHINIVTNMIMAGMSGSGTADAAAAGSVLIPAMIKKGYDRAFSAALSGAAAVMGPIIPPSVIMVLYGVIANVSIARLFIGGIVPGIIMGFYLMLVNAFMSRKMKLPKEDKVTFREAVKSTRSAILPLLLPMIIIGGILSGVFTPTESAAIASLYAIILSVFVYKTLKIRDLPAIFMEIGLSSGRVLFVAGAATITGFVLVRFQIPQAIADAILSLGFPIWAVLLLVNIFWLFMGCLMESAAIILITVPVIFPIMVKLGVDPVHLGVFMTVNLSIGLITPPVGLVMFVTSTLAKITIKEFTKAVWPFLIPLMLVLVMCTYIPSLTTFLPNLFMGVSK